MENASNSNLQALPPPPPPLPTASPGPVSPRTTSLPKPPFPISRYITSDKTKSIVSYFKNIEPVIQEGPCCGIVALSMASQFFTGRNMKSEDILSAAKTKGFTKHGEMFSAANMAKLAEDLLSCKAGVVSGLFENREDVLSCICRGSPVLVPYDADKNHQPYLNKGRNAHWAVLNGVCFELSEDLSSLGYNKFGDVDFAFRLSSANEASKYLDLSLKSYVFAYQGKSRHMALWDLDTLLLSNLNMFEVTTKYSHENMFLPSGEDALAELRDTAVLLENI